MPAGAKSCASGPNGNVPKICQPLVLALADADTFLDRLDAVLPDG